ncbi:hypothetical protein ACQ4PT_068878 [Festuca glaucescens]
MSKAWPTTDEIFQDSGPLENRHRQESPRVRRVGLGHELSWTPTRTPSSPSPYNPTDPQDRASPPNRDIYFSCVPDPRFRLFLVWCLARLARRRRRVCSWELGFRVGGCVRGRSEMEEVTEGVKNLTVTEPHKKNRIQVSNTKKPLFFYVNLAKRYMQLHTEVELSALGMAIATVVTVAEILKNNGLAVEKKIMTSTVDVNDESRGRPMQKAKIEIVLGKTENFDELMAAAAAEREVAAAEEGEEQS